MGRQNITGALSHSNRRGFNLTGQYVVFKQFRWLVHGTSLHLEEGGKEPDLASG
jgi:hypothetical protein